MRAEHMLVSAVLGMSALWRSSALMSTEALMAKAGSQCPYTCQAELSCMPSNQCPYVCQPVWPCWMMVAFGHGAATLMGSWALAWSWGHVGRALVARATGAQAWLGSFLA